MTETVQALEETGAGGSNPWKPYPAYKDSGAPWLGRVPAEWDCLPHRATFQEVLERNHPNEPMLSVTIGRGVIRQTDLLTDSSKKDSSNTDKTKYKLVSPGDLAYNKMRAWQSAIGVSQYRGIISPAYIVVRPRKPQNTRYYHYLFRTPAFATEAERWSYGITSDQWSLRPEDFKRIYCVVPPPADQDAIVRFLDHQERLIAKYIRAKQKLIALLTEQKQAIIQRAVTRGLNPNVQLKPSGVDWLGEIPEHWEVKRNGALFRERKDRGDPGKPMLVVSLRTGVTLAASTDQFGKPRKEIAERTAYSAAMKGDLAYNMMRMWQGSVGVVPVDGLVSPAYVVASPRAGAASAYYALLFRTPNYMNEVNRQSTGIVSDRNRLYWDDFKALFSPVPPVEEQEGIVTQVGGVTADIDASIFRAERQIALMREYRTRLIADVVTGKVDVRNVPVESVEAEVAAVDEAGEAEPEEEAVNADT